MERVGGGAAFQRPFAHVFWCGVGAQQKQGRCVGEGVYMWRMLHIYPLGGLDQLMRETSRTVAVHPVLMQVAERFANANSSSYLPSSAKVLDVQAISLPNW